MIEDSLRQYGAGRSILLDKHGRYWHGRCAGGAVGRQATGKKAVRDGANT
jgi:hypothetical protein